MDDILKCGHNRNSFERFCDDLSKQILRHLSFKHKIGLECVSKQWKRVIYDTQYDLEIDDNVGDGITYHNNSYKFPATKLMAYYDCNDLPELSGVTVIERLLKKCTHISHIIIGTLFTDENTIDYDQLIRIIADNCHNLESVRYRIMQQIPAISTDMWKYFGEKRGKSLRNINYSGFLYCLHDIDYDTVLRYCDNWLSITNISLTELINDKVVLAPKLTQFIGYDCERTDLMDLFVQRYSNTIKLFSTSYSSSSSNSKLIKFMKQLSQLTKLSELYLDMSGIDIQVFIANFNKIAFNCYHLNHLYLELYSNNNIEMCAYSQLLNTINNCSKLTYLNLQTRDSSEDEIPYDRSQQLLLGKLLKNCAQLTHLRINMCPIEDSFFVDIDKYLPQLKWIYISSYYRCLTDITMSCLAKLKLLKRIEIRGDSMITDNAVCVVLENCTQFNSLTLALCNAITANTIDKSIEFAIKRPKINFKHFFLDEDNKNLIEYIDTQKILFPPNLKIETKQFFMIN